MTRWIHVVLASLGILALAGVSLVVQAPEADPPRAPSARPAVDQPPGPPSTGAALRRPPARFHAPADGGEAPWPAGLHPLPPGADAPGEAVSADAGDHGPAPAFVALPPLLGPARAEARALAHERSALVRTDGSRNALAQAPTAGPVPVTATILVLPVEFAGRARLDYRIHTPDRTACITTTGAFTGPLHGAIPYPGGSPGASIDNQTVFYPSTEPEDYARLIFGRTGYTEPIRAGDPNVNGGRGVDIAGLTVERYFETQSDQTVTITGTVAPWVALDRPQAWYGLDVCIPNVSPRAIPDEQLGSLGDMTVDAAEALKARGGIYAEHAFWKRLDADGDGFVDGLWVIHAGRGQEYGGGTDGEAAIWSRSTDLAAYPGHEGGHVIHDGGTPDDPADDVRIGPFMLMPEDSDIGVLIEEFGHSFFGFPDLYTNDAENSVGWWAPMSAGIWGGELGGTRPVNMPLWFRGVADCRGQPCGWADPVAVVTYTTAPRTVVLGQAGSPAGGTVADGPFAGQTIHEGLRVDLPVQVENVPNRAGTGGGAYTGPDAGETRALVRTLDLDRLPAGDGPELRLRAFWNIPRYWGYLFVEIAPAGGEFATLPDMDGHFSDQNPFGLNEGWGLTGPGPGATVLRFDLSRWRGQSVRLRLRYITYRGGPGTGAWVDDAALHIQELGQDLRFRVDDFEAGLGGWQVDGWQAVPYTLRHPHHYLVEWRNDEGWDRSLRGAYQTSYRDQDEWRVDRVPANLPGAVVMYRNLKYPFSGAIRPQLADPPSWGAKYGLLVVDPLFAPRERPSGAALGGQLQSLDAALSVARQPDFRLEVRDPGSREVKGVDAFEGRDGVRRIDDAHGYAPGMRLGVDGKPAPWDATASAVAPSVGGATYSTRVVGGDGRPALDRYGEAYAGGHVLGTGNPGDANAQLGVRLELVGQAADGSWGAVRVSNTAVDYALASDVPTATIGHPLRFDLDIRNRGSVPRTVTVTLEGWLMDLLLFEAPAMPAVRVAPGESARRSHTVTIPADAWLPPDAHVTGVARFDDGEDRWERRLAVPVAPRPVLWLPVVRNDG